MKTKGFLRKIVVILILLMLVLNSYLFEIVSVAVDEIEMLTETNKVNVLGGLKLDKYVNYSVGENQGLLVQTTLKTGVEYKEGDIKPVSASVSYLNMPKVNDEYPLNVDVIVVSTMDTNGKTNSDGTTYTYNAQKGQLRIETLNNDKYIANSEDSMDEYQIISNYSKNCYTTGKEERVLDFSGNLTKTLSVTNEEETYEINKSIDFKTEFKQTENVSSIVSADIKADDVYDGYIYSNAKNGTLKATQYSEKVSLNVSNYELANELQINLNSKFAVDDKKIDTNELVYNVTKINKQNMQEILGENGWIKFLNESGEALFEINKATEVKDGNVEFTYPENIVNIQIQTSKPVKNGTIEIYNVKTIKETMLNLDVNKIIVEEKISSNNGYEYSEEQNIEIKQASTTIDVDVDKKEWTNEKQNEVVISATLNTKDNKYYLYNNPKILINLPQEVEKVVLGETYLLYDQELTITSANVIDTKTGKAILIELSGIQTKFFANEFANGATIKIPATIILNKELNNKESKINVQYLNNNGETTDYALDKKASKDIDITLKAKNDVETEKVTKVEEEIPEVQLSADNNDITASVSARVGNKDLSENETVHVGEVIKYKVTVKNNTASIISKLKVEAIIPTGTNYAMVSRGSYYNEDYTYVESEDRNIDLGITELTANEEKIIEYEVVVKDLGEGLTEENIVNTVNISSNNEQLLSIVNNNKKIAAKVNIDLKSYISRNVENRFCYDMYFTNLQSTTMENVVIDLSEMQKEMTLVESTLQFGNTLHSATELNLINNDGKYSIQIPKVEAGEKVRIFYEIQTSNFEDKAITCDIKMTASVDVDGDTHYSCENIRTAYPEYLTVTESCNREGEKVKAGDDIEITVKIKNNGLIRSTIDYSKFISEGIENGQISYESYEYDQEVLDNTESGLGEKPEKTFTTYDLEIEKNLKCHTNSIKEPLSEVENNEANLKDTLLIPAGKEVVITITGKAAEVYEDTEVTSYSIIDGTKEINESTNESSYISTGIKMTTSNVVKFTIAYLAPSDIDDDGNKDDVPDDGNDGDTDDKTDDGDDDTPKEDVTKTYSISGVAWKDLNKDGKKDSSEEFVGGISVRLFNADTNSIVQDDNGNYKTTTTNADGTYTFNDIQTGNYLVLFEFDTSKYTTTTYQKNGVDTSLNSDVNISSVNINGETKKVGITDILPVVANNISNIDLGLIENPKMDVKLDKYVSFIEVTTTKGTTKTDYDNEKLAKVEIDAKRIENAIVKIVYKFVVTNEGDVPVYGIEILDRLPDGVTVSDSTWLKSDDNTIKSSGLASTTIDPGKTGEITLTVQKTMNENNLGTLVNNAEISQVKTTDDLVDSDSTPNNNEANEDDYSSAQVIISLKTGIVQSIIAIIVILIILSAIAFIIWKFDKKKAIRTLKIFVIALFVGGITLSPVLSYAVDIHLVRDSNPHQFLGSDGIYYYCQHPGWYQCSYGHHYYSLSSTTKTVTSSTSSTNEFSVEKISTNKEAKLISGTTDVVIGPYEFSIKDSSSGNNININNSNISVSITVDTNASSYHITNSAGTTLSGKSSTFYIRIPRDKMINKVKVNVTRAKAKTVTKSMSVKLYYECYTITGTHAPAIGVSVCDPIQPMARWYTTTETNKYSISHSITYGQYIPRGKIKIYKYDGEKSYGTALSGAKFKVTGPGGYSKNVTVNDANGLEISNLILGEYTVKETNAPTGYAISATSTLKKSINTEKATEFKFYNKIGRAKGEINKVIKDAWVKTNMPNVTFRIQTISLAYNGINKDKIFNAYKVDYTVKTDNNGVAYLNNLPLGKYKITETNIGSPYTAYFDVDSTEKTIDLSNGNKNITIENPRARIDLEGYVWEDIQNSNKPSTTNGVIDSTDKKVAGIKVELYLDNNLMATKVTDSKGYYKFGAASGEYKLDVDKVKANRYSVRFTYNGMEYESVVPTINISKSNAGSDADKNGSKASDNSGSRTKLNNAFNTIDKDSNVEYTTTSHKSTIIYNTTQKIDNKSLSNEYYAQDKYHVYASTMDAGYNLKNTYDPGKNTISNINCGITKREQPDLAIQKDLDNVKLSINGYDSTYQYGAILNNSELKDKAYSDISVKFGVERGTATYTRNVYKSDLEYTGTNQLEAILTYKIEIVNEANTRTAQVNSLIEYFDEVYGDIYQVIGEYTDSSGKTQTYIIPNSNITYDKSTYKKEGYYKAKINLPNTDNLKNYKITGTTEAGVRNSKNIYVSFKLNRTTIKEITTLTSGAYVEKAADGTLLDNVVEIGGYTTYDGNKLVAGVDHDSKPENGNPSDVLSTGEDDTDKAPSFIFVAPSNRTIEGNVFEDSTTLNANKERFGNGYLDNQDSNLTPVTVTIYDDSTGGVATYFNTVEGQWKDAITQVDSNGAYKFEGVIPERYHIQFTWGDKNHIVENYKSTTLNENLWNNQLTNDQWFRFYAREKSTQKWITKYDYDKLNEQNKANYQVDETRFSDATDDLNRRTEIDGATSTMNNALEVQKRENADDSYGTMTSNTPTFNLHLEYDADFFKCTTDAKGGSQLTYNVKNIDFGIAQRPQQELALSKYVAKVQLLTADGNSVVDVEFDENGNKLVENPYITLVGETIKLELENELIQGSTLIVTYGVKVTNASEIDYAYMDNANNPDSSYYMFGVHKNQPVVELSATKIFDYVDNFVVPTDDMAEDGLWTEIKTNEYKERTGPYYDLLNDEIRKLVEKNVDRTLITEQYSTKSLKPNESVNTLKFVTSKLLANSEDLEIDIGNSMEIVEVSKANGGSLLKYYNGNYEPASVGTEDTDDAVAQNVTVIPPTGENRNYAIYVIIGISALIIIGAGVVIIKRKAI